MDCRGPRGGLGGCSLGTNNRHGLLAAGELALPTLTEGENFTQIDNMSLGRMSKDNLQFIFKNFS